MHPCVCACLYVCITLTCMKWLTCKCHETAFWRYFSLFNTLILVLDSGSGLVTSAFSLSHLTKPRSVFCFFFYTNNILGLRNWRNWNQRGQNSTSENDAWGKVRETYTQI